MAGMYGEPLTSAQIREALIKTLDFVNECADRQEAEGQIQDAAGMRRAVRLIKWRFIGTGEGCVVTVLDPRREEDGA